MKKSGYMLPVKLWVLIDTKSDTMFRSSSLLAAVLASVALVTHAAPPPAENAPLPPADQQAQLGHAHGHAPDRAQSRGEGQAQRGADMRAAEQPSGRPGHGAPSFGGPKARQLAGELQLAGPDFRPLPAGVRKKVAKGRPLPAGLERRLPPETMQDRLPQQPGYEWRVAGTDLILVEATTAVVHQILRDVFIKR